MASEPQMPHLSVRMNLGKKSKEKPLFLQGAIRVEALLSHDLT
jgi:hypothetical protein